MVTNSPYASKPFDEAIAYLRGKINLPSDRYDDYPGVVHDAAFIVAGAKGNLLSDIREAVDKAIAQGQRPDEFRDAFEKVASGWSGNKAWRADLIYSTNVKMAYGAGRNQQQLDPDVVKLQPYLKFNHSDNTNARPTHAELDGVVFSAAMIPFNLPSGFGCGCRYTSLSERSLLSQGLSVSTLKRGDMVAGEPLEPAPGFDYAPGMQSAQKREAILKDAIARAPSPIAQQMREEGDRLNQRFKESS